MKLLAASTLGLITIFHMVGLVLASSRDGVPSATHLIIPVWYAFALVGALIVLRGRSNRVAWFCLAIGLAWAIDTLFYGLYFYGTAHPGTVPNPELWQAIAAPLWAFSIFAILTFIPMYFPDGNLPSRRWRFLPWMVSVCMVGMYASMLLTVEVVTNYGRPRVRNPLVDTGLARRMAESSVDWEAIGVAFTLPLFVGVALSIAALVVRYRRSIGVERQQLRWMTFAGSTAVFGMVVAILLADDMGDWVGLLASLFFILIPISIGIAIFRYRLYDIDRVVSKTISYAVLVGLLSGVYSVVAVGVPFLLPATLNSPLLVAFATLAVAALFNPLRRAVQRWVDKRFNRLRYDAQKELDALALRLRDAHDAGEITNDMLEVVAATMQPTYVGIWVKQA